MTVVNPRLQNICDFLRVKPYDWASLKIVYKEGHRPNVTIVKSPDLTSESIKEIDLDDVCDLAMFFLQTIFTIGTDEKTMYENHRKITGLELEFPMDIARVTYEDGTVPIYFGEFHSKLIRSGFRLIQP